MGVYILISLTNFIGKASEPPGSGSPVGGGLITITAGEFKCFTATCCCLVLSSVLIGIAGLLGFDKSMSYVMYCFGMGILVSVWLFIVILLTISCKKRFEVKNKLNMNSDFYNLV